MRWLEEEKGARGAADTFAAAARGNQTGTMALLRQRWHASEEHDAWLAAAGAGAVGALQWLWDHRRAGREARGEAQTESWTLSPAHKVATVERAAASGQLAALEWLYAHRIEVEPPAGGGDSGGFDLKHRRAGHLAVNGGHLEVLEWAARQPQVEIWPHWSAMMLQCAASSGRRDVMTWLLRQKDPQGGDDK